MVHFPAIAKFLQIPSHLLALFPRRSEPIRRVERCLSWRQTSGPMSSLGRQGIRPGALSYRTLRLS
ncbi:hypothetical protein GBAR_LOCUS18842 [Geodia barretti]|uniref:Uncharacterized protein n=1 Tax=Geodia barretti TaxID=519541 RepID=A0AA35SNK7_GEOBA|nr:hypothetical protein GBAR_LOCUS18842 [Geodia barretti]